MKTDIEICKDLYRIVGTSALIGTITGNVSYTGRETDREDCVISVLESLSGQIQDCVVNVNVYVQDITSGGKATADIHRLSELADICKGMFGDGKRSVFGDGFKITLEKQRVLAVEGRDEHVINNSIRYKYLNE